MSFRTFLRKWLVMPSSGQHWDVLDGLRGVAILMVLFAHGLFVNPAGPLSTQWLGAFFKTGATGVQVFFVLSGFLISQPFFKARSSDSGSSYIKGYFTRRVLKILPPFYFTILLLSAYYYWRYHDMEYVMTGLKWAVGIPHLFFVPHGFNGVFWSLWVEVGFYTLLPLLFWALRGRTVWQTGAIIATILLVVPFVGRWLVIGQGLGQATLLGQREYLCARLPNALTNFSWGVLFACLFTASRRNIGSMRSYAKIGYAGIGLMAFTLTLTARTHVLGSSNEWGMGELLFHLVGFSTFLMLFFLFDANSTGTRFFSTPVLRYLGLISYELFLLHQPALNEFRTWMGSAHGEIGRYLLIVLLPMAASLAAASLLYHWYSTPIIKWGRNRLERARAVEARRPALPH